MKKGLIFILVTILLTGCQLTSAPAAGVSDADMATRVAKILTEIPTQTPLPQTDTPTPLPPSATPLPSATNTSAPTATITSSATPTVTNTSLPSTTPLPSLTATAANTLPPTLAPSTNDPRERLGVPVSADPMDNSTFWNWGDGPSDYTSVTFDNGFMKITGLTSKAGWRMPSITPEQNFYVEMTAYAGPCSGRDSYGIIFRVPNFREPTQGYIFEVSCDGFYKFWMWDGLSGPEGTPRLLLGWKASETIRPGPDQPNRLGVMAVGNRFYLYINGYRVGEYSDVSFTTGSFGIVINPDQTTNFSVRIDDMSYWNNPTP